MADNGIFKDEEEIVTISRTNLNKALGAVCFFGFAGGLVVMYGIMSVKW